ncbi:uncharacterized protein LOC115887422 [Sitophilus oryzae]|uniref:Uncharacterized protein LOC115887422 n=1 Tax=Sitophilus oryzae TaxID=7048 RepID=A0A6J2YHE9_SITOR|nr:uncharacterized protein LOC115887422 [Sitophilus oryzae]
MSYKVDPKEVLIYLNNLGYTNVTATQLKEFIVDLKKLMKYDKRYNIERENVLPDPEESEYCECSENKMDFTANESIYNGGIQTGLNIPSEKPTNANVLDAHKNKHISLHIYESKTKKNVLHEHCIHINDNSNFHSHKQDLNKESDSSNLHGNVSTFSSTQPVSSRSSKTSVKDKKSKVSFIRPTVSKPSFNKCDPVALYHHYQSEWKKSKIPGQDKREDLRWAIRERMCGGPKVELKTRAISRRCSSCR